MAIVAKAGVLVLGLSFLSSARTDGAMQHDFLRRKFVQPEQVFLQLGQSGQAGARKHAHASQHQSEAPVPAKVFGYHDKAREAASMRFSKKGGMYAQVGMGAGAQRAKQGSANQGAALPQVPAAPMMGAGMASAYQFGSPMGRGVFDGNQPFVGSYGRFMNFGPLGGPSYNGQGMGSYPQFVDPRGFGMKWNRTEGIELGDGKGIMPGFGKPVFPGTPFPATFKTPLGLSSMMGTPPFTGQQVRALSPMGPFAIEGGPSGEGTMMVNHTLMGPLPFGPYGHLPSESPEDGTTGTGFSQGHFNNPMTAGQHPIDLTPSAIAMSSSNMMDPQMAAYLQQQQMKGNTGESGEAAEGRFASVRDLNEEKKSEAAGWGWNEVGRTRQSPAQSFYNLGMMNSRGTMGAMGMPMQGMRFSGSRQSMGGVNISPGGFAGNGAQHVGTTSSNSMSGLVQSPMQMPFPSMNGGWGRGMMPVGGVMNAIGEMGANQNMVGTMPMGYPMAGLHPAQNPMTVLHHAAVFPNMGAGMEPAPGLINAMGSPYPHPSQDRYHTVLPMPPPQDGAEAAAA